MSNWTTRFVSGVGEIGKPALIASLLLASGAAQGNIVYVNGAVATSGNGSSWANAYKYLRDALEHSSGGDPIYVAKGTYYPDDGSTGNFGDRELSFELDGQKIYGGFAGNETALNQRNPRLNPTVLSGAIWDGDGEDVYWSLHVVFLNQNSALDGVTVENGHANGSDSWNYPGINSYDEGGGCYVKAGKVLTLSGCTFRDNRALSYGGAIMVEDNTGKVVATDCLFDSNEVPVELRITTSVPEGGAIKGNVQADNCRFIANKVVAVNYLGGKTSTGAGGAISGNVTAVGCKFSGNSVFAIAYGEDAVDTEASGGAISGNVVASRCEFSANESTALVDTGISSGGAISGGSVVAVNCSFSKNESGTGTIDEDDGTGEGGGGAIYISDGKSSLANCVFVKNTSGVRGGAIHQETRKSSLTISNCSFLDNGVATGFEGAALSCGGIARILNNVFWCTSSSAGGFDQDNLIHVILDGVLRNSDVNYPTPASIAPNIVRGGTNGVSRDAGGNVLIVNESDMLINDDPLFTDDTDPDGPDNDWGTADDGLRISSGSPAIVTARDPRIVGAANLLPKDSVDIDGDGVFSELLPLDYAGFLRVQQTFVDIGAYEFGNIVQSPEISIAESGASGLSDGGSTSYGSVVKGASSKKTFTIKNVGTKLLKDISFAMKGSTMFVLSKPTITSLKPGASVTFAVRFNPTGTGKKTSTLLISSNDADESPFHITLTGTGVLKATSQKSPVFAAAASASTAFTLASSADRQSDAAITTTTVSDGSKHLVLTVQKSADWSLKKHTVEVSSNLLDWFSGSNYTTTLLNSSTVLSVRDNAPLIQGEKRYIRLK